MNSPEGGFSRVLPETKAIYETFVAMEPVAKGRPRVTEFGTFNPAKTRTAEAFIKKHFIKQYKGAILEGALALTIVIYIQKPVSKPKKCIHPITRPDIDNYIKLIMDALNGILWKDDSQVVELYSTKVYAGIVPPGFSLTLRHAVGAEEVA